MFLSRCALSFFLVTLFIDSLISSACLRKLFFFYFLSETRFGVNGRRASSCRRLLFVSRIVFHGIPRHPRIGKCSTPEITAINVTHENCCKFQSCRLHVWAKCQPRFEQLQDGADGVPREVFHPDFPISSVATRVRYFRYPQLCDLLPHLLVRVFIRRPSTF